MKNVVCVRVCMCVWGCGGEGCGGEGCGGEGCGGGGVRVSREGGCDGRTVGN